MKRCLFVTAFSLAVTFLLAQSPQAINYQAVLRGNNNSILSNQDVNLRISILEDSLTGNTVYKETHTKTTSQYGIVNLAIGAGTVVTGVFADIDWGGSSHYIKVEADTAGGANYYDMGTSQLLTVPYAFYANKVANVSDEDINHWNEAFLWGDHALAGYLTGYTETDPKVGSNTLNYVPKWNGSALTSSVVIETENEKIGIGTASVDTNALLHVAGIIRTDSAIKINDDIGLNDTVNQVTAFDFDADKLKYNTYVYRGGILTYSSEPSTWVESVGDFLSPSQPFECGDSLVDSRDGQYYATVLIGAQCWMADNLNLGTKINNTTGGYQQTDNGVIEKYCYNNDSSNCDIYGGLYEWPEAMQYVTVEGAQGICPAEWHLPTDDEWKILEGTVDSQYQVGDPEWDESRWRGYDVGGNLKETGTTHWYSPNVVADNPSGFKILPGGYRSGNGEFLDLGHHGYFLSSSQVNQDLSWYRGLYNDRVYVYRNASSKSIGNSVRCLRGCWPQPAQANAGSDQLNVPGTSVTLSGNTPAYGIGVWHIISGTGGTIADTTNPISVFTGLTGIAYSITWTITSQCGSTMDSVWISFSSGSVCGDDLVYEGQSYETIQIGTQCWIVENLNVGTQINSSSDGFLQTDNGLIEKYCYSNNSSYCDIYGGLYEWPEAMQYVTTEGAQGICPNGWHIPTSGEWVILSNYLGGDAQAGGKMKSTGNIEEGTGLWASPNTGATNSSGFTGLPGGYRINRYGHIYYLSYYGSSWSSSQYNASIALLRTLYYDASNSHQDAWNKDYGLSVRCIKDD